MFAKNLITVPKSSRNPDRRTQYNSGYAAYVGARRVAWSLDVHETIKAAKQHVKTIRTKNRFVPPVVVFDCSAILIIGMVTDDANGIQFHLRNAQSN